MGNFCSDPTNLVKLLSLTGERLDSPHSLYYDALLISQSEYVPVCTLLSNHSLFLKPPKHSSASSASYSTITRHHSHYKIPQERSAHVSQLPVSSYCLWRSNQISLFIKHLLICETYRFEKMILLLKPVTKNPHGLTTAAESLRVLGFAQHWDKEGNPGTECQKRQNITLSMVCPRFLSFLAGPGPAEQPGLCQPSQRGCAHKSRTRWHSQSAGWSQPDPDVI